MKLCCFHHMFVYEQIENSADALGVSGTLDPKAILHK